MSTAVLLFAAFMATLVLGVLSPAATRQRGGLMLGADQDIEEAVVTGLESSD